MKVREHRGGFEESMATMAEIEGTIEALAEHIGVSASQIRMASYGGQADTRNGWPCSFLVLVDEVPWGFTDGPVLFPLKPESMSTESLESWFGLDIQESTHWKALQEIQSQREAAVLKNATKLLGSEELARRCFTMFKEAFQKNYLATRLFQIKGDY